MIDAAVPALAAAVAVLAALRPRGAPRRRLRRLADGTAEASSGRMAEPTGDGPPRTVGPPPRPSVTGAWQRHRDRRAATVRARVVADVCAAVAAELHAGRGLDEALRVSVEWAASPCPLGLTAAVRASETGGDVAAALARGAGEPGAEGLAAVAACWAAARASGSGLAAALGRLALALRAEQEHRRDVAAQLAGPRASARILFLLPAFGLLLGQLLGAAPARFLLASPAGLLCAVAGLGLDVVGLVWTTHLVRQAEQAA